MSEPLARTLAYLTIGADRVIVDRANGKPCPAIKTPDLLDAFLHGTPCDVTFAPSEAEPFVERINNVRLSVLTPSPDGYVRAVRVEFDDHRSHCNGLLHTDRAVFAFAEQLDCLGLYDGALFFRSRRGFGWHCVLIVPPTMLSDAVLAITYLVQLAFRVAEADSYEGGLPNAFLCVDGIVTAGSGRVECSPGSSEAPPLGYPIRLTRAPVDPWTGTPIQADDRPLILADREAWTETVLNARKAVRVPKPPTAKRKAPKRIDHDRDPFARCDERTRAFLRGSVPEGERNKALFASVCNALGYGIPFEVIEHEMLSAALRLQLPEREALATIRSAARTVKQ